MKIVKLLKPYILALEEAPLPSIHQNEVLLQIQAVGICGSDMHRYRGDIIDSAAGNDPLILGHEFSATIAAMGSHVKGFQVGERVAVEAGIPCGLCEWCFKGDTNLCPQIKFCGVAPFDGALREYMAWPGFLLHRLPDSLTFKDGVLMEILAIALHATDLSHMQPGQTAAVLGSGPIGLAVIQLLRQTARTVLIASTDILDYRNDFALKSGSETAMNPDTTDVVENIMQMTGARGVDVVFEAAGVPETCRQAVEMCAPGGKVIFIGIPTQDQTPFSTTSARRKGLTFRFVRRSPMLYPRCAELLEKGTIDLHGMVTHHFPLSKTAEAFALVDQYQDRVIKAIVHPNQLV
jgi:L-iditol 2-dehydrogenase